MVVVQRDTWKQRVHLVGHVAPVDVVREAGKLMKPRAEATSSTATLLTCVCAASPDGTVSIWIPTSHRPVAVLKRCIGGAVTDISWSQTSLQAVACGLSGEVAVLTLTMEELGATAMSRAEWEAHLARLYGVGRVTGGSGSAAVDDGFLEVRVA